MNDLLQAFNSHRGLRGIHVFVDGKGDYTGFIPWDKAVKFLAELGEESVEENFMRYMAEYDPDHQILVMIQEPANEVIRLAVYTF